MGVRPQALADRVEASVAAIQKRYCAPASSPNGEGQGFLALKDKSPGGPARDSEKDTRIMPVPNGADGVNFHLAGARWWSTARLAGWGQAKTNPAAAGKTMAARNYHGP
jgi:hypothetical protein